MNPMYRAMGFVTAGGLSSRMGRDKAWLEIDRRYLIERVLDAVKPVTTSVGVIASGPEYSRLGVPVFPDKNQGVGPLEAIRTALYNTSEPLVVLAGCDLPFLSPELLAVLLEKAPGYQATIPMDPEGRLEPLCGIYSVEALDTVTECIANGVRKVSDFLNKVNTRLVPFEELSHLQNSSLFFCNVNTPEDYTEALRRAEILPASLGPDTLK